MRFVSLTLGFLVVDQPGRQQSQNELIISIGGLDEHDHSWNDKFHFDSVGRSAAKEFKVSCLDDKNVAFIMRIIEEMNTYGLKRVTFRVSVIWALKHELCLVEALTKVEGSCPKTYRLFLQTGAASPAEIISVADLVLENTLATIQIKVPSETQVITILLSWLGARHGFDRLEVNF